MTKIKNTKKGMAKKTLSMSLVVAMLATSNVPVWAAEFSDGTDAAVTSDAEVVAPVVTDNGADEFSDNAETEVQAQAQTEAAAPVVEDTEAVEAQATEETSDKYVFSDVKLEDDATNFTWNKVNSFADLFKEDSYILNAKGEQIRDYTDGDLGYALRYDGEWSTANALTFKYSYTADLSEANVTFNQDELKNNAGKTFDILILEKDDKGAYTKVIKTISFGTIQAVSLNDIFKVTPSFFNYDGTDKSKKAPTVEWANNKAVDGFNSDAGKIEFDWAYSTTNDYVNAGSKIKAIGTLKTPVAGYGTTLTADEYTIGKLTLDSDNVVVKVKTPGKDFAYKTTEIDKSEVDVFLKDYTKDKKVASAVSLNDYVKKVTLDPSVEAGKPSKVIVEFDSALLKASTNFNETSLTVNSADQAEADAKDTDKTVDIVALDLASCDITLKNPAQKGTRDDIQKNIAKNVVVKKGNETLDIANDITVTLANGDYSKPGTYKGVVTVAGKGTNVTGTKVLDLVVVDQAFADTCNFKGNASWEYLTKNPAAVIDGGSRKGLDYNNGKEVTIDPAVLGNFSPDGNNYTSDQSNFKITYSNNVNATTNDGTAASVAKLTVTAIAGDYVGCSQDFYFAINPSKVAPSDSEKTTTVTTAVAKDAAGVSLNEANDNNAAGYADVIGLKVNGINDTKLTASDKGAIVSNATASDYTVKYSYVSNTDDADGSNKVDQYVKAEITLNKDGNFTVANTQSTAKKLAGASNVWYKTTAKADQNAKDNGKVTLYVKIANKSIDTLDISLKNSTFTFTGEVIKPEVVVKNGSKTLKADQYKVTVDNGINAGTADITVTVDGYNGSKKLQATINPADINNVKFELKKGVEFTYDGESNKPTIAREADTANKISEITEAMADADAKLGDVVLSKMFDITYGKNVDAGKEAGTVTLTPKALYAKNFTGSSVTATFEIKKVVLEGTVENGAFKTLKLKDATGKVVAINNDGNNDFRAADKLAWTGSEVTFASTEIVDGKVVNPNATAAGKSSAASTVKPTEDDYEVKYINNVDKTTEDALGYICVVGKGNFTGEYSAVKDKYGNVSIEKTKDVEDYLEKYPNNYDEIEIILSGIIDKGWVEFEITGKSFGAKDVTVTNPTYAGGLVVKPVVTVKDSTTGATLVEGTDYELDFDAEKVDVTDKALYVEVIGKGQYNGSNIYKTVDGKDLTYKIEKKDLKDCYVKVVKNEEDLNLTVMNGNVTETKENFDVKDNGDGTATVSVVDGGKNYTGSATVTIEDPNATGAVGTAMISDVKVEGNKATVVLSDEVENATGYDYVIATEEDYKNGRVDIAKNQIKTTADFTYVQEGTYYAYCHAWKRGADGKKVFGEWSNLYKFEVEAQTPSQPVIQSVKVKGSDVTVTYTKASNAKGYDVVLGDAARKVNGEYRPVEIDEANIIRNVKADTVSVTFKNVKAGTYYVGLHAYNRSNPKNNDKVFSKWSNVKSVTVK